MNKLKLTSLLLFPFTLSIIAQSPGDLDMTFGDNGKVLTKFHHDFLALNRSEAIAVDDTRIYVVGESSSDFTDLDISFAVYDHNGELDMSFGDLGRKTFPIEGKQNGTDVKVNSEGEIFISGFDDEEIMIIKLRRDGSHDTTWAEEGIASWDASIGFDRATKLALKSDGKIVAAGYSDNGTNNDITLVQFLASGEKDLAFASDGVFTMDLQGSNDRIEGLAIQTDNKILVCGTSYNTANIDGFLMRFTQQGDLDDSFHDDGLLIFDDGRAERFDAVSLQPDNQILVGGSKISNDEIINGCMFRYNPDGSLDSSFGANGISLTNRKNIGFDVSYHQSERLILFGHSFSPETISRDFSITVFDMHGNLYTEFGDGGTTYIDMGPETEDYGFRGAVQPNGDLLLTGHYSFDLEYEFAICRIVGPYRISSTDEQEDLSNMFVYPNPANSFIRISDLATKQKFEIYNAIGQNMKSGEIDKNQKIHIEDFLEGVYFIKLSDGSSFQFVKG